MIDGYNNSKNAIKTGISQGSWASPILFLIYVGKAFEQEEKELPKIMFLSFVDDLSFIFSGTLVQEITKALEKIGNPIVEWGRKNAITYNMTKIELVIFSQVR